MNKKVKRSGGGEHRSPYLFNANEPLYHLSYTPFLGFPRVLGFYQESSRSLTVNRTGTSPASHRARPFCSSPIPPTPPFNCCVRLCLCWPSAWPSAWPSCLAPTGCRERQGDVHRRGALGQERAGGLQAADHDLVLPLERRREERPRPLLRWPSGSSLPLKPPPPAFSRSSRTSILDFYSVAFRRQFYFDILSPAESES